MGYGRTDGKVGIRNRIAVISSVECSSAISERIASFFDNDVVSISHQQGCMQLGDDLEQTKRILFGLASNPNIFGVLFVGLGCEQIQAPELAKELQGKPAYSVVIQEEGSSTNAIMKGISIVMGMKELAAEQKKHEFPISKIHLGVKCGASDPCSGLAANPALGEAADALIRNGAAVVMGTESLYGSEHVLARRCISKGIADSLVGTFDHLESDAIGLGQSFEKCNPTPGNIKGGITTMAEKALGAMLKGGTSPIVAMLKAGEIADHSSGLKIVETRGTDLANLTILAAAGCQVIVFTTGRGFPMGIPTSPVIKLTGTKDIAFCDYIDVSVHGIVEGDKTIYEGGDRILSEILKVCNGKLTKSEIMRYEGTNIPRIGTVL